mmetsp:Transcript_42654/g.100349  ORF Transcript_42654/g.100349 Transcript_42654/m.100349 type:complete len:207 (+) Transcript_42654:41-661(+)
MELNKTRSAMMRPNGHGRALASSYHNGVFLGSHYPCLKATREHPRTQQRPLNGSNSTARNSSDIHENRIPACRVRVAHHGQRTVLVFCQICSASCSSGSSRAPATTSSTCLMWQGSCRFLMVEPAAQRSFFTHGHLVWINLCPACVGRTSHQGASVSRTSRLAGICRTISRSSGVFREQPLMPMQRSRLTRASISSVVPVNEWTMP